MSRSYGEFTIHPAMVYVCEENIKELEKYLLTGDPNFIDITGSTLLMWAAITSKTRSLACLLKHPACNPNLFNERFNTALMLAIEAKSVECVELLCKDPRTTLHTLVGPNKIPLTPLERAQQLLTDPDASEGDKKNAREIIEMLQMSIARETTKYSPSPK
jgi:ankyrin repeat protein